MLSATHPLEMYGLLLFPFTRELLGFGNLSRGHFGRYHIACFCCFVTSTFAGVGGCRSKVEPFMGLYIVLRNTFSIIVHHDQVVLRESISLISCKTIPFQSFGMVLRDIPSSRREIRGAKRGLRSGIPLSSSFF